MNDEFSVSARVAAFDKRHGGNPARLSDWWWYADGATREVDPLGALLEPPADEYTRLTNILNYHKGRRLKAVREFDALRNRLLMLAEPDRDGMNRLKRLQDAVGELNLAVQHAEQALAETEEGKRREQNRRDAAEERARRAAFRDELRAVRI